MTKVDMEKLAAAVWGREFDAWPDETLRRIIDGDAVVVSEEWLDEAAAKCPETFSWIATCVNRKQLGVRDRYVAWIGGSESESRPDDLEWPTGMGQAVGSPHSKGTDAKRMAAEAAGAAAAAAELSVGQITFVALGEDGRGREVDSHLLGAVRVSQKEAEADAWEWLAQCWPHAGETAFVRQCRIVSVDENGEPDELEVFGKPVFTVEWA